MAWPSLKLLGPEEVAADDVARLPDQEMIGGEHSELPPLRQDCGLDAPRISQALQDQLIGGGGALLAVFQLGKIAIDGHAAGILGAALADLDPTPIDAMLQHRLAGIAVARQAVLDPGLRDRAEILDDPLLDGVAQDVLIRRAGLGRSVAEIEQLLILVVAEHQAVLVVVEREALGDRLDGVGRRCSLAASAACSAVLRAVTSLQEPTTSSGWPFRSRIRCCSSATQQ